MPRLGHKPTVLLVDDSPLTIEIVRHLLESAGFAALAADSLEAAEAALTSEPGIVVLDVNLPEISGVELCMRIKRTSDAAVILFSDLGSEELARLASEAGADAYLSKQNGLRELPERLVDLCEAASEPDPEVGGEALRVLLIDDSEIALHYEQALLELAGFEVRCVRRLLEFVQELTVWQPHLILSDVRMPEVSGDELCSSLKKHMSTRSIPIVLFSAMPEAELAELARRSGADAYLSKADGYEQLGPRLRELSEAILW